jgi:FG-GAP-like repeat
MSRSTKSWSWRGAILVAAAGAAFLVGRCLEPKGLSAAIAGNGLVEPVLINVGDVRMTLPGYRHFVIDPHPASNNTLEKALVDINGDGRLDVVLGGSGLYWYRAPAPGNLAGPWVKHKIAGGDFYEDVAIADVNGDGVPDLIASDNNQLAWFENPRGHGGDPATDPWPMHVIRRHGGAHVIRAADIDGDSKIDIVISSSAVLGAKSAILFQNSPDSWTEVDFGHLGEGVALLDIGSGLGRVDIAGGDGNKIVWFENPRKSGGNARTHVWTEHVAARLPAADKASFAGGVFSADGRMDLIVAANEDMSESGLYRIVAPPDRRGSWSVDTIDPSYMAVHKIDVGDMNRDGHLDFVVAEQEQAHNSGPCFCQNFDNQRLAVFYGDGNGNFTQQILATTGGHNQALGDINGDGDLDILNSNHGYYGAPNPLEIWMQTREIRDN